MNCSRIMLAIALLLSLNHSYAQQRYDCQTRTGGGGNYYPTPAPPPPPRPPFDPLQQLQTLQLITSHQRKANEDAMRMKKIQEEFFKKSPESNNINAAALHLNGGTFSVYVPDSTAPTVPTVNAHSHVHPHAGRASRSFGGSNTYSTGVYIPAEYSPEEEAKLAAMSEEASREAERIFTKIRVEEYRKEKDAHPIYREYWETDAEHQAFVQKYEAMHPNLTKRNANPQWTSGDDEYMAKIDRSLANKRQAREEAAAKAKIASSAVQKEQSNNINNASRQDSKKPSILAIPGDNNVPQGAIIIQTGKPSRSSPSACVQTTMEPTNSTPRRHENYPSNPVFYSSSNTTPSITTPSVNNNNSSIFSETWNSITGWFTGRTAREKIEKKAAERSRIAMGYYRARIACENERKTAIFNSLSNLQENNTRLGALFSPAKTIPYKAPDQPSSHSGDSQHLYLSDEGRARLLENQLIRMYGKKAVDELIRKNIELDDARAEREEAERQRDLLLAERSRSRYEFDFMDGKVPLLAHEEQAAIDQSLADVPENIVDLADQAAQKVEDLKRSHPFFQGPKPPRSPNEASRIKAAFDLRAYQDAEKKKAEEVERSHKRRLEIEERAAEQDWIDRKSGKKLAMQALHIAIGGLSGSAPKNGGGPINPSQGGSATATISEYGAVVISYPKAAISSALANISARLFGRGPSSSVGSGGSRTPEEPEVKEQENPNHQNSHEAAEIESKIAMSAMQETSSATKIELHKYWESLMRDPAHGNKITMQSIEEAIAGIAAEQNGFLAGPLKRDITPAAEFIDKFGQAWDVKAAVSRAPNGKHIFDPNKLIESIKRDLLIGENIILDLRKLEGADIPIFYEKIRTSLTSQDVKRILVVIKDETLNNIIK